MIFVFDLEGPLSPMDHAAEAMRFIGSKLGRPDFFDLFAMLSEYDDILTLEEKPGYNPGDTLRLIAPIISTRATDEELISISKTATLTPGAKDLIASLPKDDVYVASTSYQQHALTIARQLGIRDDHVNCTRLQNFENFPKFENLQEIFEDFKNSGKDIKAVRGELDSLFWEEMDGKYLSTVVCGGRRKEEVLENISKERAVPLSEFIAVGDSITDIHMLARAAKEHGLGVSFNGNEFSVPKANLAVSAMNIMALKPLVEAEDPWEFVSGWNTIQQDRLDLLKPETRDYFIQHKLEPYYDDLRAEKRSDTELDGIIKRQKEMRKEIRKEYAQLG